MLQRFYYRKYIVKGTYLNNDNSCPSNSSFILISFFLKKGLLLTQRHNLLKHTMCVFCACKRAALIGFTVLFGFFRCCFLYSAVLYRRISSMPGEGRRSCYWKEGLDGPEWTLPHMWTRTVPVYLLCRK